MKEHVRAPAWRALSWWEGRMGEPQTGGLGQGSHLPGGAEQGRAGDLLRAACEAKHSCQSWLRGTSYLRSSSLLVYGDSHLKLFLAKAVFSPTFSCAPLNLSNPPYAKNAPHILPPAWLSWKIFPSSRCSTASNPAPISCRGSPISQPTASPGQAAAGPRGWQTLSHPHALPPLTPVLLAGEGNTSLPLAQAAKQRCAAVGTAP